MEMIPLVDGTMSFVVSSMALHHLLPENRRKVFSKIYDLLRPGGIFVNMDFYTPDRERNVFTQAGERGPTACSGYGMDFMEYLAMVWDVGFKILKEADQITDACGNPIEQYLNRAVDDFELSMPINKATYYTVLTK